jgi:hypothetical protein
LIPTASTLRLFAGKVAQPALMTALAIRDPEVRRLAPFAGRSRVGAAALAQDLWRLAALRRGVRAGLFSASATLENSSRRLVITTDAGPPHEGGADGLAEALASGTVEELIWNHSRVGTQVPLIGAALVPSRVGSERVAGAHSFRALVELARSAPEQTISALKPLLRTHT